jgi:PAS domain S-box-containing protein
MQHILVKQTHTTGHIYVKDEDGHYLFCNDAQARSLGLSIEEIIGRTDFELSTLEVATSYREADLLVIKNGKPIITEERALYNDKHVTYLSTKSPLYGKNKEVMGVVGISFDITDTQEKEQLLLENNAYKIQQQEQQTFKLNY